jgi:hypothetical protein
LPRVAARRRCERAGEAIDTQRQQGRGLRTLLGDNADRFRRTPKIVAGVAL